MVERGYVELRARSWVDWVGRERMLPTWWDGCMC